jgi:hypothetical protein
VIRRRIPRILAAALLALAVTWPVAHHDAVPDPQRTSRPAEWPRSIAGETLRPIAPSAVEARFAARFPGAIGRFASGDATWVLRRVEQPTRMLHPASDCYRGLGYSIRAERLVATASGLERCFVAVRARSRLEVCERIVDADGGVFTDTSGWYWQALLGRSRGPWLVTTRAAPLAADGY